MAKKKTAAITGVGAYLPDYILDNIELSQMVDTSDEWIMSRIGIKTRHILKGEGLGTSFMGEKAVLDLLEKTNTDPMDIEMVICATVTPDMFFPSTANLICYKTGMKQAFGFDLSAACSGFLFALNTASKYIEAGTHKKVIVIGADKMSSIINYNDRNTCPIFGDGAAAVLLEPSEEGYGVLDAVLHYYQKDNANPHRGVYELAMRATDAHEGARHRVARFFGAEDDEIVFTQNTTESLNLVAYSYGLSHVKAGDEILISTMEHHSNILPWQMVCRQTGATLKFMECEPDGSLDLYKVEQLITERTKLVALTQVSNVLGRQYPVREIAAMAHKKGAVIVVDGAQSTPHIPVNVRELGADFLAFSGHKLYGPMGIGGLYGRRELLDEMPPFLSGGEMIETVTREGATYAELPHKFEAGTVNAAGAAGLHAAIDYVRRVGFDTIHSREIALTTRALEKLRSVPHVHILGSEKPEEHCGILSFTVDGVHPHDISEILASDGVNIRAGHHCAQPLLQHLGCSSTARASFAFYNTEEDADRFVAAVSSLRERMGYGE